MVFPVLCEHLLLGSSKEKLLAAPKKILETSQIWKPSKWPKLTLFVTSADQSQWVVTATDQNLSGESHVTGEGTGKQLWVDLHSMDTNLDG